MIIRSDIYNLYDLIYQIWQPGESFCHYKHHRADWEGIYSWLHQSKWVIIFLSWNLLIFFVYSFNFRFRYTSTCSNLLAQYKTAFKLVEAEFRTVEEFCKRYKVRLKSFLLKMLGENTLFWRALNIITNFPILDLKFKI